MGKNNIEWNELKIIDLKYFNFALKGVDGLCNHVIMDETKCRPLTELNHSNY